MYTTFFTIDYFIRLVNMLGALCDAGDLYNLASRPFQCLQDCIDILGLQSGALESSFIFRAFSFCSTFWIFLLSSFGDMLLY